MPSKRRQPHRYRRRALTVLLVTAAVCFAGWYGHRWHGVRQARLALSRHDPAAALEWLNSAAQFGGRNAESHFLTARAYRRMGDAESMRRHLERANELGWPQESLDQEFTLAQAQAGMIRQAEPRLKTMLLKSGDDGAEICAAFVNGYVHHYQFAQAFTLLDAWQQDFPDDPEPYLMRGRLRHRWQDWKLAEQAFQAALERRPESFEAHLGLASALAAQHQHEAAEQHFRKCLHVDPDHVGLLIGWGECLANLGRNEEAAEVFQRVIKRDEANCFAHLGLGKIALDDGRAQEALALLAPAVAACPNQPDVRYVYAQALLAAGRADDASEHLEYFSEASKALHEVSHLTLHLVSNPDDLQARFDVGRLYLKYGSPEEGANWLKTVLAVDPNHLPTHKLLAEYYQQSGYDKLAQQHRKFASQ